MEKCIISVKKALEAMLKTENTFNTQATNITASITKATNLYPPTKNNIKTQEHWDRLADMSVNLYEYKEAAEMFKKAMELVKTQEDKTDAIKAAILCLEKLLKLIATNR